MYFDWKTFKEKKMPPTPFRLTQKFVQGIIKDDKNDDLLCEENQKIINRRICCKDFCIKCITCVKKK